MHMIVFSTKSPAPWSLDLEAAPLAHGHEPPASHELPQTFGIES